MSARWTLFSFGEVEAFMYFCGNCMLSFCPVDGDSQAPRWKKLSSVELGIRSSMISKPTRVVLNALKKKGKGHCGVVFNLVGNSICRSVEVALVA